jgi:hypothetical protein
MAGVSAKSAVHADTIDYNDFTNGQIDDEAAYNKKADSGPISPWIAYPALAIGLFVPGLDDGPDEAGIAAEASEESGTALARQLGSEGERLVPVSGNTVRIPSPSGSAAYRIPDILNPEEGVIGEVKNVASLSYTSQLRDFAAYAEENDYQYDLYVRTSTQLSGPLQDAIEQGTINLRFLPG